MLISVNIIQNKFDCYCVTVVVETIKKQKIKILYAPFSLKFLRYDTQFISELLNVSLNVTKREICHQKDDTLQ